MGPVEPETLRLEGGAPGLLALLARAEGLDAGALARLRDHGDGTVDVFTTTPFEVIASRRIRGAAGRDGAVVRVRDAREALAGREDHPGEVLALGPACDPSWPGALPPAGGFRLVDTVPVAVVRSLADEGQRLAREFSGPLGPPASLMNQDVLTVESKEGTAKIPMRMIFTCTSLGLIPGFKAGMDVPRYLRVSTVGRWIRIDAPFGTVYHSTGLSLV